jgi:glycogen phosphorylase
LNFIQPAGHAYKPIPERIGQLNEIAYNLWWSWQPDGHRLFSDIDPALWELVYHNSVKFLNEVRQKSLQDAAENKEYLAIYDGLLADFQTYMKAEKTWFADEILPTIKNAAAKSESQGKVGPIAYFCFEFGLHESLPIYSGGLGVLAGDHVKGASDLGVPMLFVGYLYPQGYFKQQINKDGWQEASYGKIDFDDVPALPALTPDGHEVIVEVDLPGRAIYAKVYRIEVGRSTILMLDTDIHPNAPTDRTLAANLYGGDQEMRVAQEIVLGIGGVRAIRALGIEPSAWHMNEGHAAFLVLELARERVKAGEQFGDAMQKVSADLVFTTHTPVAAGNDAFPMELIDKYFSSYYPELGVDRETFLGLAREGQPWGPAYSMTTLALKGSEYRNGVSRLHGRVSRNMWHWLWPDKPVDDVPISYITNGVHTGTWLAPELYRLWGKYIGEDWYARLDDPKTWEALDKVPDAELWEIHMGLKHRMAEFARSRVMGWYTRTGAPAPSVPLLNPDALTIGFARRFATYKRATLLFSNVDRLLHIIGGADRPVQFVFAGKAHPKDDPGKQFIQQVYWASRHPGLEGKVLLIEDYDMNVARYLVQGVDVWLNTPRRPHEASGTSGMKAAMNGIPNFSVLDGWWAEGFNGRNGWAIGEEHEYGNPSEQDWRDVESLYVQLEQDIVPRYYSRDEGGVPAAWVATMKESIRSATPQFSMRRQVKEYTRRFYLPAIESMVARSR